jgi:hypothetical protein
VNGSDVAALGTLERVLALKAIAELSALHPDDLAGLAVASTPIRFAAGSPVPALADAALFLLAGSLRSQSGAAHRAPCTIGLVEALCAAPHPELVADAESSGLAIQGPALRDLLAEEFALALAALRHVCAWASREGVGSEGPAADAETPAAAGGPGDLVGRIGLLRRGGPFRHVSVHLVGRIAARMRALELARGELLREAERPAAGALCVLEGSLGCVDLEGVASRAGPGSWVGLLDVLGGRNCPRRIEAKQRSRALWIDKETLFDVLEDDPGSAIELACALARASLQRTAPR